MTEGREQRAEGRGQKLEVGIRLLVIPTDEELEIAEQTVECIKTVKPANKFL